MQVLIAVLDDLFQFATKSLFGKKALPAKPELGQLPEPEKPLLALLPATKSFVTTTSQTSGSYFIDVPQAQVHQEPVVAFDNVVGVIPYATSISVLQYAGRWALIQAEEVHGWILKDQIAEAATDVVPQFTTGQAYDANHETTVRLRKLIHDMFACADASLPLTSAEYVTYRLLRNRRTVTWPGIRPRLPGRWQSILRGVTGIHIGIVPKTGAVMEYTVDDIGFLFYVEAVFPDESIQLSTVDFEGLGVYTEQVLRKDEWRELRPIFIEVL